MKQDLFRRGGVVRQSGVGAELALQTSHVTCMCLHVHLEGRREGGREGYRESGGREGGREGERGQGKREGYEKYGN